MGKEGSRIIFWSAALTHAVSFVVSLLAGHYVFARLPLILRRLIIIGRSIAFTFSAIEPGHRFLFVTSCAPVALAYRQALVSSGGPVLIGSILDICSFLTLGSPVGPDRSSEDIARRVVGFGYEIPLNFLVGLAIPEIEPSWAFFKAQAQDPLTRWLFFFTIAMSLISLYWQFETVFRYFGQMMYRSALSAAFDAYGNLAAGYYRRRFALQTMLRSAAPFEYERLDQQASEVRLLRILPARWGAQVEARLEVHSVASMPAFEAISYRWRTGSKVPILLNGGGFMVSQAVYSMLQGLRHDLESRLVWIDAICINQEDISERQWQVLLMGDIYSSALRVVCWLGYHPLSAGALSLMATLADFNGAALASGANSLEEVEATMDAAVLATFKKVMTQLQHPVWAAVHTLMRNEWFSRVWVVQEVAKGREVILYHGKEHVSWDVLRASVAIIAMLRLQGMNVYSSGNEPVGAETTPNIFCISALRQRLRDSPGGLPLGFLLRETAMFKATLPSDKTYGVLSLSTQEARKRIAVDYTLSEDIVFRRTTRYTLMEEQCLEYLMIGGAGFFSDKDSNKATPSWVPDRYYSCELLPSAANISIRTFQTATHAEVCVRRVERDYGERWVAIDGVLWDEIACISPVFYDPYVESRVGEMTRLEQTECLVSTVESAISFAQETASSMDCHEDAQEVVWTVMMPKFDRAQPSQLHEERRFRESAQETLQTMKRLLAAWKRSPRERTMDDAKNGGVTSAVSTVFTLAQHETALKAAVMPMLDKRLCRTAKGHLAVVPPYCEKGDKICVFAGANFPCVIREQTRSRQDSQSLYKLLGACYVYGIMHGELSGVHFPAAPIILT